MTAEETTALAPGNTKPGAIIRARAFQFTLNEVEKYNDLLNDLKALKTCDYIISCKEKAPKTGHEHIHIYAHFNQTYRISKKLMKHKAHIEICRGSPKQNIDYNKHQLNIKGGSKINNYNLIIITSVQPIDSIYSNMTDEPRKQWLRRVNVIDMYNDYNKIEDLDIDVI